MNENEYKKYYLLRRFINKHTDTKEEKHYDLEFISNGEYALYYGNKVVLKGDYDTIYKYLSKYIKETFCYKGKKGYLGLVSLLDYTIEAVIPVDQVFNNYGHHYLFLDRGQFERVENNESALFFVYKGKVISYYDHYLPKGIEEDIKKQIEIL